ncbi:MAG: RHS repeat-associated core domain-containing protein, partial [Verrucomicrobiales bacterium]|nr:RHS repeat-associated core domain-containing protein [Verrucomicrobiales bacterium]
KAQILPDNTQITYTYDDDGNRISRTEGGNTDTYSYDYNNRLQGLDYHTGSESAVNGIYQYSYDHRTRRLSRDERGTITDVVYSGGVSIIEKARATNQVEVEFVRAPGLGEGGPVRSLLYSNRGGQISVSAMNARGDVTAKITPAENVGYGYGYGGYGYGGYGSNENVVSYEAAYKAFGDISREAGETEDRQKANTKEQDPHGLINDGFRYRDAETGSFITRDPAGFVDGPNLYTYVRQNPWTAFDPKGLYTGEGLYYGTGSDANPYESFSHNPEMRQWAKVVVAAAVGIVVTAATAGAAAPVVASAGGGMLAITAAAGVAGAAGGAASQLTSNAMNGTSLSENVGKSALTGAVLNQAGAVASNSVGKLKEGIREGMALKNARAIQQATSGTGKNGVITVGVSQDFQVVAGASQKATGLSNTGLKPHPSQAVIDDYKNIAGQSARTTCGEVRMLTNAEAVGVNMVGGTSATVARGPAPRAGTPMEACSEACSPVLKAKGIGDAVKGTSGTYKPEPIVPVPVKPKKTEEE